MGTKEEVEQTVRRLFEDDFQFEKKIYDFPPQSYDIEFFKDFFTQTCEVYRLVSSVTIVGT